MYSSFRLIMKSISPCVIALMFMCCLSSGFTGGLTDACAASAVLMLRLVHILRLL